MRQVLGWAQEAAGPSYISTEHLLLGLVRQEHGPVAQALTNLGVPPEIIQRRLAGIRGVGTPPSAPHTDTLVLNPPAQRVLQAASEEAKRLQQPAIGPEHLLLALVGQGNSIAIGVLDSLGVAPEQVRAEVLRVLGDS